MMADPNNHRAGNKETVRSSDEVEAVKPLVEDHEARARTRIAELRAIHGDDDYSEVYIDKWFAEAPPGWIYNWKTHSVWNKEYPHYLAGLKRNGWSPVPAGRVRHLLYPDYDGETVIIDGLILMERPKEICDRVSQRDYRRAIEVVRTSERKLADAPAGTAPRDHEQTTPRVRGHVGPVSIAD